MTIEEKQVKVAQSQGWVLKWQNTGGGPLFDQKGPHCWEVWIPPIPWRGKNRLIERPTPPDYTTNLHALQDAWKALDYNQQATFGHWLAVAVFGKGLADGMLMGEHDLARLANAFAIERFQALGLTLKLWEVDDHEH